jgi:hypothetical protein
MVNSQPSEPYNDEADLAAERQRVKLERKLPNKQCGGPCQLEKPREEFDLDASKADGRRNWCKECRKDKKLAKARKGIDALLENVDASVLATLSVAPIGGTNLPHQVQALEGIIGLLGGVDGFNLVYVANLMATTPGSETRSRILNKILAAIQLCSDDAKVSKPLNACSEEELDARLKEQVIRIAQVPPDARESA